MFFLKRVHTSARRVAASGDRLPLLAAMATSTSAWRMPSRSSWWLWRVLVLESTSASSTASRSTRLSRWWNATWIVKEFLALTGSNGPTWNREWNGQGRLLEADDEKKQPKRMMNLGEHDDICQSWQKGVQGQVAALTGWSWIGAQRVGEWQAIGSWTMNNIYTRQYQSSGSESRTSGIMSRGLGIDREENHEVGRPFTTPVATGEWNPSEEATGGTASAHASASASTSANPDARGGESERPLPPENDGYVTVEECLHYTPEPEKTRAEMCLQENLFDRHLFVQFLQMGLSEVYPQCPQFSYDQWMGQKRMANLRGDCGLWKIRWWIQEFRRVLQDAEDDQRCERELGYEWFMAKVARNQGGVYNISQECMCSSHDMMSRQELPFNRPQWL